jgi:hypothetical protein
MTEIKHGSASSYQRCRKRPEGSCEACRKAAAEYVKAWRRSQPAFSRARSANRQAAIRRAHLRLAEMYPAEFQTLLSEEMFA